MCCSSEGKVQMCITVQKTMIYAANSKRATGLKTSHCTHKAVSET